MTGIRLFSNVYKQYLYWGGGMVIIKNEDEDMYLLKVYLKFFTILQ